MGKTIAEKFIERKGQGITMPNPRDVWKAALEYLQVNATTSSGSFQDYLIAHCPGATTQNAIASMATLFGNGQNQGIQVPNQTGNAFGDSSSSFESSSSSISGPNAAISAVK